MNVDDADKNAYCDVSSGCYEAHYQLKPGDKVLDLGAHVGFFTEYALSRVGQDGFVIAFEPHPDNFDKLFNRIRAKNCLLLNSAASNIAGRRSLWNNPGNTGGHSLNKCGQHDNPIDVSVVNIGSLVSSMAFCPNFVKMDTEGSEFEILVSLLPHISCQIAFEVHDYPIYHQCKRLLMAFGYNMKPEAEYVGVCYAIK